MECWVVIPAYNEEASIAGVIRRVPRHFHLEIRMKVLLVDDGSYDLTEKAGLEAGADAVLRFEKNRGLGAAVREGLQWAYERGADMAVMIDGDGEYPAEQIPRLLDPILRQKADYVMGSRFKGSIQGMRLVRRLGNYGFTLLLMVLLRRLISDGQTGMRAFSRAALSEIDIIHDYNYAQVMTLNLVHKGFRLLEVPIDYKVRTTGESFVKLNEYLRKVLPAILREICRRPSRHALFQPAQTFSHAPAGSPVECQNTLNKLEMMEMERK